MSSFLPRPAHQLPCSRVATANTYIAATSFDKVAMPPFYLFIVIKIRDLIVSLITATSRLIMVLSWSAMSMVDAFDRTLIFP
jgi:hypothetical protein